MGSFEDLQNEQKTVVGLSMAADRNTQRDAVCVCMNKITYKDLTLILKSRIIQQVDLADSP